MRFALPDEADASSTLAALRAWPRVLDVVIAGRVALVRFDPACPDDPRLALRELPPGSTQVHRQHVIDVRYDGLDLDEVARFSGVSREEVIALHSGRAYTVELVGFQPGFAYLGPVDPRLAVPRRGSPRPRVPVGAVGLAAGRTAVYPWVTPGGWQLIGTAVGFVAFSAEHGATLALGDQVVFRRVG